MEIGTFQCVANLKILFTSIEDVEGVCLCRFCTLFSLATVLFLSYLTHYIHKNNPHVQQLG